MRALALVAALLLGAVAPAFAQSSVTVPTIGGEVSVLADRIEDLGPDGVTIATGNVELTRGRARLSADRIEINRNTGDAVASGRVVFYDGEDRLTGDRIDYNVKSGTGVVHHASAAAAPYYRLSGDRMERVGDSVYRVKRGIFTTCEDDPPAWSFHFDEATADLEDYVAGTNASFWVKSIPLIPYFPFFAAAIRRERQTGFLFPVLGSSSRKGFYAEIPFFWAISESQDLTTAFAAFEKKGFGGRVLYRYRISEDQGGSIGGFYINESLDTKEDRGWGQVRHEWRITPSLRAVLDANLVSDDLVLRDYSTRLSERSLQRVDTNAFVSKAFDHWNIVGNFFTYQDLTTERGSELRRLPEIRVDRIRAPVPGLNGLLFDFESSATYFQRDIGNDGFRVDLHPRFSRPFRAGDVVNVTPFVGGRVTAYDRTAIARRISGTNVELDAVEGDSRVRQYVETGVDLEAPVSRVYTFDRWGLDAILHRIEPRVSYLFLAGNHMDRLPLYTERIDRIKEASLIEYSLTNRILGRTASGPDSEAVRWEAVRFVVGHSIDLRSENHTVGDLVTDLIVQAPSIFRLRGEMRYGVQLGEVSAAITDFSINLPRVSASIGTRYDAIQKTSFVQGTFRGEISKMFVAHLGTNWDLRTDTFVESRIGLDIRFQCYEFSMVFIDRAREIGRKGTDDEFRFSLNLLGIGGPIRTTLGP